MKRSPSKRFICTHLRREIGGAGVDRDAGQQHQQFEVMQVRRLPHHVLAGQVVAALFENLNRCRGNRLAKKFERSEWLSPGNTCS
jgi:hypothetical protein